MNESLSTKDAKKLNKASALSYSNDPKDQDRARARQTEVDYKDLVRQLKAKRKMKMKEDWKPEIEHVKGSDLRKKAAEKKRKKAEDSLPPHLKLDAMKKAFAHTNESAVLDANTKISKDEKKKKKEAELRRLLQHAIAVRKGQAESFEIDKSAHKKAQKKSKMRNLAKGNTNPNEKAAAEKKAGGPKLYGEEDNYGQAKKELKATKKARDERHNAIHKGTNTAKNTDVNEARYSDTEMLAVTKGQGKPMSKEMRARADAALAHHSAMRKKQKKKMNEGKTFDAWKKAAASAVGRKKEEKKAEKAQDAGSKARRMLKRREHAKYVSGSEDNVPDEMRD